MSASEADGLIFDVVVFVFEVSEFFTFGADSFDGVGFWRWGCFCVGFDDSVSALVADPFVFCVLVFGVERFFGVAFCAESGDLFFGVHVFAPF